MLHPGWKEPKLTINKPMSAERRNILTGNLNGLFEAGGLKRELVEEIIRSEAFFREGLKKLQPDLMCEFGCFFCDSGGEHEPDCLWKLAQE